MSPRRLKVAGQVLVREFEYDRHNLAHLIERGIDEELITEVWLDEPVFALNVRGGRRVATHLMIGEDAAGTLWTIALLEVDQAAGVWRPITGWPAEENRREVEAWLEGNTARRERRK